MVAALVLSYYVVLRSVLRLKPWLRKCLARCRHCGIFFLTDVRNAGLSMSAVPNGSPLLVWAALPMIVLFGGWAAALARRGSIPAWMPGLLIGGAGANLADRAVRIEVEAQRALKRGERQFVRP